LPSLLISSSEKKFNKLLQAYEYNDETSFISLIFLVMFQRMCSTCVCHLKSLLIRLRHFFFSLLFIMFLFCNEVTLLNNKWNYLIGMLDEAQPANAILVIRKMLRRSCKVKGENLYNVKTMKKQIRKKGSKEKFYESYS